MTIERERFLEQELERAHQTIRYQKVLLSLNEEKIRLLIFKLFGPKSEKLTADQAQMLLDELLVQASEVETEGNLPESEKQKAQPQPQPRAPRQAPPGRNRLPDHLERREKVIPCHPKDCTCATCGAERPVIGYEVSEKLCCERPKFYVQVTKLEKRASHCQEEQGVAVAPAPRGIVPKGKLSDEFIIEVLIKKFQMHQPIYRQCIELLNNHGIDLSRQTLNEAVLAAGELLIPVTRLMREELLAGNYIQADETTVPCQTREKAGRNHTAYLWEYSRPRGLVIFDFRMGRDREGPREFLKGYKGKLQCDGYKGYDQLGEAITYIGCMAHLRRKFIEYNKVAPDNPAGPEIIEQIAKLYAVEEEARSAGMDAQARYQLRQQKSKRLMEELKAKVTQTRQGIQPGGKLAQACDYALKQWSRVEEYLNDGQVEIDNNWCEGAMRPVALGRKNWLHVGSEEAGKKLAAIASIVETCRRLQINPRDYLGEVLPKLGDWPVNQIGQFTPTAWKTSKS